MWVVSPSTIDGLTSPDPQLCDDWANGYSGAIFYCMDIVDFAPISRSGVQSSNSNFVW